MRGLERLNPATVIVLLLPTVVTVMFAANPFVTLASLLPASVLMLWKKGKTFLKNIAVYIMLILLLGAGNMLLNHRGETVLLYANDTPLTLESFLYGANFTLMLITTLIWFSVLGDVITSEALLYLVGGTLPTVALLISSVFRYIPLLIKRTKQVGEARKALGYNGNQGVADKMKSAGENIAVTLSWSLENAIDTADSMNARGYGVGARSVYNDYKLRAVDKVLIFTSAILFFTACVLLVSGFGSVEFFPSLKYEVGIHNVILQIVFFLLSALPLIVEIREELLWKRSK